MVDLLTSDRVGNKYAKSNCGSMSAKELHVSYEQRFGLRSKTGTMRQPDCFIVNGTVVLFVWPMQWVTSFSGG
jgi:hypothetical protein